MKKIIIFFVLFIGILISNNTFAVEFSLNPNLGKPLAVFQQLSSNSDDVQKTSNGGYYIYLTNGRFRFYNQFGVEKYSFQTNPHDITTIKDIEVNGTYIDNDDYIYYFGKYNYCIIQASSSPSCLYGNFYFIFDKYTGNLNTYIFYDWYNNGSGYDLSFFILDKIPVIYLNRTNSFIKPTLIIEGDNVGQFEFKIYSTLGNIDTSDKTLYYPSGTINLYYYLNYNGVLYNYDYLKYQIVVTQFKLIENTIIRQSSTLNFGSSSESNYKIFFISGYHDINSLYINLVDIVNKKTYLLIIDNGKIYLVDNLDKYYLFKNRYLNKFFTISTYGIGTNKILYDFNSYGIDILSYYSYDDNSKYMTYFKEGIDGLYTNNSDDEYINTSSGYNLINTNDSNISNILNSNSGTTSSSSSSSGGGDTSSSGSYNKDFSSMDYNKQISLLNKVYAGIVYQDKIYFYQKDKITKNYTISNPIKLNCSNSQFPGYYNSDDNKTYTLSFCDPYFDSLFYISTGEDFNNSYLSSYIYYNTYLDNVGFKGRIRINPDYYSNYLGQKLRYVDVNVKGYKEILEKNREDKLIFYGSDIKDQGYFKATSEVGDKFCGGSFGIVRNDLKYFECFNSYIKNFKIVDKKIIELYLGCSDDSKGIMYYQKGTSNQQVFTCENSDVVYRSDADYYGTGKINYDVFNNLDISGSGVLKLNLGNQLNGIVVGDTGSGSCKMFNSNGNFIYYSNGYLGINLPFGQTKNIYIDGFTFVTEKTVGLIIGPINSIVVVFNIFTPFNSTDRDYCLLGSIVHFKDHQMFRGTEFYQKMTMYDYLAIFAFFFMYATIIYTYLGFVNPFDGTEGYIEEKGVYTRKNGKIGNVIETTTSVKRTKLKNAEKFNTISSYKPTNSKYNKYGGFKK